MAGYNPRPKHGPHISISDDNHHVTDAISSLYDYNEQQAVSPTGSRPLSFLPSVREEIHLGRAPAAGASGRSPTSPLNPSPFNPASESQQRPPLDRRISSSLRQQVQQLNGFSGSLPAGRRPSGQSDPPPTSPLSPRSPGTPRSPGLASGSNSSSSGAAAADGLTSPTETAERAFPIDNIDYESSPAAVAQELSNLQALRRMSMNVDAGGVDPDLPSFGGGTAAKAIEEDPSRLFWVPARLHPELAPKEFKSFLDSKVDAIKRKSGEFNIPDDNVGTTASLGRATLGRSASGGSLSSGGNGGGLRRSRSKLSKQIDNTGGKGGDGYQDGADMLVRKKSEGASSRLSISTTPAENNLAGLEKLMQGSEEMLERLSLDLSAQKGAEASLEDEDMPIIPAIPGPGSLKRSTRTTYRKGSLKRGERVPGSRRALRGTDQASEGSPATPPLPSEPVASGLHRSATDPVAGAREKATSNFSRPSRPERGQSPPSTAPAAGVSFDAILTNHSRSDATPAQQPLSPPVTRDTRDAQYSALGEPVPQIVETPPPNEPPRQISNKYAEPVAQTPSSRRRQGPAQHEPSEQQTLQHMASHPSPLPGNSTRTDSLSFIPTLTEDKKSGKPISKKRSKEDSGSKKSGWSWGSILGSEEKDDKKDKKRKEAQAAADRDSDDYGMPDPRRAGGGSRSVKGKATDNTRLDLLQQTMDMSSASATSSRGRESLVLDRGDVMLEQVRRQEHNRKSSGTGGDKSHKEKDSGLFHSLFGGKKRGGGSDRDSSGGASGKSGRSSLLRPNSPQDRSRQAAVAAPLLLVPDVDYNWTRFSILEERAIYRMAHIKLANPRRELRSQVLLSNFMYSYLAKVQQMHPQMQIPQSAAQKAAARQKEEEEKRRQQQQQHEQDQRKRDQPEEYYQYQRYQELQAQDAATAARGHAEYIEDSQNYDEYDQHGRYGGDGAHDAYNGVGYGYQQHGGYEQSPYQYQQGQFEEAERGEDDDDMW